MRTKIISCCACFFLLWLGITFLSSWERLIFITAITSGMLSWQHWQQNQQRKELQMIRTRLAADLHDDIGATLSQIAVLTEVLRRQTAQQFPQFSNALAPLVQLSGETIDALSDIVWSTNPRHDSLLGTMRRMRRFASDLLPAAQIEFSFVAPALELAVEANTRCQLLLIFKESLNNIVRHAGCTRTEIICAVENDVLCLQIKDNGNGFSPQSFQAGNGLANMQRRAQSMGAKLTVNTSSHGTIISLRIRLLPAKTASQLFARAAYFCVSKFSYRKAWQFAQSYLNRGVTTLRSRATLRLPLNELDILKRKEMRRRVL